MTDITNSQKPIKQTRRSFLYSLIAATGLTAISCSTGRQIFTTPQPTHQYTLPTVEEVEGSNPLELILDLECRFGSNGAIPYATTEVKELALERFHGYLTQFLTLQSTQELIEVFRTPNTASKDKGIQITNDPEPEPDHRREQLLTALEAFNALMVHDLQRINPQDELGVENVTQTLMYSGPSAGRFDCDTYAAILLGMMDGISRQENINIPAYLVLIPEHAFVRFDETTNAPTQLDSNRRNININFDYDGQPHHNSYYQHYLERTGNALPIENTGYMNSLTQKTQLIGHYLSTIAHSLHENHENEEATRVMELSCEWLPNITINQHFLAFLYELTGQNNSAQAIAQELSEIGYIIAAPYGENATIVPRRAEE
jgi:hypothetical protein